MSRIETAFQGTRARWQTALLPYLMVGYPSIGATSELLYAIVQAGADLVELGVPFSDPLADGATLQRANQSALEGGANLAMALSLVSSVRSHVAVPLILMSYCNPILRMGITRFACEAGAAGVDGLIVPDLPLEESDEVRNACREAGMDLVGMVAPTSPASRIADIARAASGFVYCVTLKGVTGARSELSPSARPLVECVRSSTDLPAVVGFGVSSPQHVKEAGAFADGAVVASALLDRIDRSNGRAPEAAARFVSELKAACARPSGA